MSSFINKSNKYMDLQLQQMKNAQDFIVSGSSHDLLDMREFDYILSADAHGTSFYLDILKNICSHNKLDEYLQTENPMKKLSEYINCYNTYGKSGFCCIIVKIYKPIPEESQTGIIKSWSVGDSQIVVIKNSEMLYVSCPHNLLNSSEIARLQDTDIKYTVKKISDIPKISTKQSLVPRKAEYIVFNRSGSSLAISQALGHNGVTGILPEYFEHLFTTTDKIRIVVGSDGFWEQHIFDGPCQEDVDEDFKDLSTMTAKQLIDKTMLRWRQMWKYYWIMGNTEKFTELCYEEGDIDDVNIGIWDSFGFIE